MNYFNARSCALAMLLAAASPLYAAPMGFNDSWMAMGDLSPNWRELYLNYAATPRDAVGASITRMRSDDGSIAREVDEVTYTRLLKRWNMPHAQANVWFIGGAGAVRGAAGGDSAARAMLSPGIQVDYETTRVYASAFARLYRAHGINHDVASARAGFSFYEADYEQTQPWLIVEVRRMHGLSERTEVTPLLRLINKSYFVEAGVNNMRQLRVNFMRIF